MHSSGVLVRGATLGLAGTECKGGGEAGLLVPETTFVVLTESRDLLHGHDLHGGRDGFWQKGAEGFSRLSVARKLVVILQVGVDGVERFKACDCRRTGAVVAHETYEVVEGRSEVVERDRGESAFLEADKRRRRLFAHGGSRATRSNACGDGNLGCRTMRRLLALLASLRFRRVSQRSQTWVNTNDYGSVRAQVGPMWLCNRSSVGSEGTKDSGGILYTFLVQLLVASGKTRKRTHFKIGGDLEGKQGGPANMFYKGASRDHVLVSSESQRREGTVVLIVVRSCPIDSGMGSHLGAMAIELHTWIAGIFEYACTPLYSGIFDMHGQTRDGGRQAVAVRHGNPWVMRIQDCTKQEGRVIEEDLVSSSRPPKGSRNLLRDEVPKLRTKQIGSKCPWIDFIFNEDHTQVQCKACSAGVPIERCTWIAVRSGAKHLRDPKHLKAVERVADARKRAEEFENERRAQSAVTGLSDFTFAAPQHVYGPAATGASNARSLAEAEMCRKNPSGIADGTGTGLTAAARVTSPLPDGLGSGRICSVAQSQRIA
ncbi:hypothetical protein B0H13DRAFT_1855168 [Mycena leptocephala]|nr:hypothetical protein B0H13DRAFT_1855168 [Mycena leptocephala]